MIRTLVVNADDFGLTPGVNAGIIDAHLNGIVTSASLFANAPATDDAILLARRTRTLGVGCHLTLVDGAPVRAAAQIPTLARDGRFRSTWGSFLRAALAGRIRIDEVERELSAQIDRLRSDGVALTHLDAHKHVHAYPPIFRVVVRLARRFAITVVRVPCEESPLRLLLRFAGTKIARRQAIENLALVPWALRDRQILAQHGLPSAPHFSGRALTGILSAHHLHRLISAVPNGISELMTHPGYPDAALEGISTRLRATRSAEVALLTAPETRDAIHRLGIVLARHDGQLQRESHVA